MQEFLKQFPYLDLTDINAIGFDVVSFPDGVLNVQMVYLNVNDDGTTNGGVIMRTAIEGSALTEVCAQVEHLLKSPAFDYLVILDDASCFDIEANLLYQFLWSDYSSNNAGETLQ